MSARKAKIVGGASHGPRHLGRQHHLVSLLANRTTRDFLGDTVRIHVRGVDEVTASVEEAVDDLARRGLVAAPFLVAEGHGSEAEVRDLESSASQFAELHGGPPHRSLPRTRSPP